MNCIRAIGMAALVTIGVISFAHGIAIAAETAARWRIELISTGDLCGKGTFAQGTIETNPSSPDTATLTLDLDLKEPVTLRLDSRGRFSKSFESSDGEGYRITGALAPTATGTWESPTLSCSGTWSAKAQEP